MRFLSGLLLYLSPLWAVAAEQPVAIALHGGAGTIERDRMSVEVEAEYRSFLDEAISEGYQRLQAGEEGLDVVVAIIQRMEDSPLFNAGKGSVYTWHGQHELDASIMHGSQLDAGAVAGVTTVKSPIALARAVMEQSPHVMLASRGAEQLRRSWVFLRCRPPILRPSGVNEPLSPIKHASKRASSLMSTISSVPWAWWYSIQRAISLREPLPAV